MVVGCSRLVVLAVLKGTQARAGRLAVDPHTAAGDRRLVAAAAAAVAVAALGPVWVHV